MTEYKPYKSRALNETQWFWFLAFMGLLTRLPLLRIFSAETTDGVLCMTYFSPDLVQPPRFIILPGYPALLWLVQQLGWPGWLWGRIFSSLFGLLSLIPLWKLSRRWVSIEMSGVICLMALFSPLLWEWSLRVMPDTLFLLVFWWGLERLTTVYIDKNSSAWWEGCLAGTVAACTRPEGFLLLPWLLVLGTSLSKEGVWKRLTGLGLIWMFPIWFLAPKFLTLLAAYQEGGRVSFPFINFVDHLYAYLSQSLYVFTPLVFWFAVLGLAKMARRKGPEGEAFQKILFQIFILLFLSRLVPTSYQDRHMLPFLPLLLLAAGYHLESFFESLEKHRGTLRHMLWKNGLLSFCMAWLALFSSAVIIAEHDSFGDIKRSAEFLKTLPSDAVIYTDELPKTQFWSGRKVILMSYLYENKKFIPRPGDYIILHSIYVPSIDTLGRYFSDTYGAQLIREDTSMLTPLLTDVMEDQGLQNRIVATAFRFKPQFFSSQVYVIQK